MRNKLLYYKEIYVIAPFASNFLELIRDFFYLAKAKVFRSSWMIVWDMFGYQQTLRV